MTATSMPLSAKDFPTAKPTTPAPITTASIFISILPFLSVIILKSSHLFGKKKNSY
tara:strand:+ start:358 stop:525 length:168 start_codon:yes stop_codon:yes gene_type:complete